MYPVGQTIPCLRVVMIGIVLIIVDSMNGLDYALRMGLGPKKNALLGSSGVATANNNGVSNKKEL